jgi:hypothetical protein
MRAPISPVASTPSQRATASSALPPMPAPSLHCRPSPAPGGPTVQAAARAANPGGSVGQPGGRGKVSRPIVNRSAIRASHLLLRLGLGSQLQMMETTSWRAGQRRAEPPQGGAGDCNQDGQEKQSILVHQDIFCVRRINTFPPKMENESLTGSH